MWKVILGWGRCDHGRRLFCTGGGDGAFLWNQSGWATTRYGIIQQVGGVAGISKGGLEDARGYTRGYERRIWAKLLTVIPTPVNVAIMVTPWINEKAFVYICSKLNEDAFRIS